MTYDEIVQGLRDSTYELENEGRLVRAGLKTKQDTASIVARYEWLYSENSLAVVDSPTGEVQKRVRAALLQGIVGRRTAAHEDRLTTFYAEASARAGDERFPFYTAQAQLVTEPDPRRREALGDGIGLVMAQAEELHLELNETVQQVVRDLGFDGYVHFWSSLKEIDYEPLRAELVRVADAAHERYRTWVEPRMAFAGRAFGDCPQAHMPYFRSLAEHDAAFTKERFEPAMRRTFERLGLDLFSAPTISIDLADRASKDPRASVCVPEAGREVHLLSRPSGGNSDYSAFLHEAGHALHFGLSDPAIGWPLANLGRSMAYTELWSFLFERIGHDPVWIADATGVGEAQAERIASDLTGVDLMLFTRYVGKFSCELELYRGDPLDPVRGRRVYVDGLTERTGFKYDPRAWQFDRDPGFYSADYLRAWMAEAALEQRLRERFGESWWASRDAGQWLRRQWLLGSEPEAEETVASMGGKAWSGEALLGVLALRLPVTVR
ncbi:MAG TPA: hypothetical protein VKK19_12925 [Candidatus Dormibacteraeota bacterium]|nr:hypothetical protein [Candidatus Dormibacteraeota bacterium]